MVSRKPQIAIVDDDESVREAIKGLMRSLGFSAEAYSSAEDFLSAPLVGDADCLIVDVNMPGMNGLDLHSRLAEHGLAIPTILITAYPNERVRARAISAGVVCYLSKPFDEADLLGCLRAALAAGRLSDC